MKRGFGFLGSLLTVSPLVFGALMLLENAPLILAALVLIPLAAVIIKIDSIVYESSSTAALAVLAGLGMALSGVFMMSPLIQMIGCLTAGTSLVISLWSTFFAASASGAANAEENGTSQLVASVAYPIWLMVAASKRLVTDALDAVTKTVRGVVSTVQISRLAKKLNAEAHAGMELVKDA